MRAGSARRAVRGFFAGDAFMAMEVSGARDFNGTFRLRHERRVRDLPLFPKEELQSAKAGVAIPVRIEPNLFPFNDSSRK